MIFFLHFFQRIPRWWIWYYWICPLAWSVYGLIVTQYGDLEEVIEVPGQSKQTISYYVTHHFGYHRNFMPVVAPVLVLFAAFFAFMYAVWIKKLNFQQRQEQDLATKLLRIEIFFETIYPFSPSTFGLLVLSVYIQGVVLVLAASSNVARSYMAFQPFNCGTLQERNYLQNLFMPYLFTGFIL